MTFPKKNTRNVVVDGLQYSWHLNNDFDIKNSWIVVQCKNIQGQLLCIDPYPHEVGIGSGIVAKAIRYALTQGWKPIEKRRSMYLTYDDNKFTVLPDTFAGS
jgi:hypothetical protein